MILYMELHVILEQCSSIKHRRAAAQRLVTLIKNHYNASVKIVYSAVQNQFHLKLVALGESQDYLEALADTIGQRSEAWLSQSIDVVYDIEAWPFS